MLALALVLEGWSRTDAARSCGMDRQTLRDWVHRYNAAGLAGLRNLKSPGPGSKLTARQQAELAELVDAGPDPAVHGVVRWRRVDLRDELQRRFGVALHERSVGKVRRRWRSFRQALTTIWQRDRIETLSGRLEKLQRSLSLLILIHVR